MTSNEIIEVLDNLLQAEVKAGNPPGSCPSEIFDGPLIIENLIKQLREKTFSSLSVEQKKILIGSISGGYLGRGELLNPFLRSGALTFEFRDRLRRAVDELISQLDI